MPEQSDLVEISSIKEISLQWSDAFVVGSGYFRPRAEQFPDHFVEPPASWKAVAKRY